MKREQMSEEYQSPSMELVEVELEGGYSISYGAGGYNEDLDEFEDMEWY